MRVRPILAAVFAITAGVSVAGCGGGSGSALSCDTYNSVKTNPAQYSENSTAVSALLMAHGVNPAGDHHYSPPAGDYIMNITVASEQVSDYCRQNPGSTIDKAVNWSKFGTE